MLMTAASQIIHPKPRFLFVEGYTSKLQLQVDVFFCDKDLVIINKTEILNEIVFFGERKHFSFSSISF